MSGSCIQTGKTAFTPAADIAAEAVPDAAVREAVQEAVLPAIRSRNRSYKDKTGNGAGEAISCTVSFCGKKGKNNAQSSTYMALGVTYKNTNINLI